MGALKNFFKSLTINEDELIKEKENYIEITRIKEGLINIEVEKVKIPKSTDPKLLEGFKRKEIEVKS